MYSQLLFFVPHFSLCVIFYKSWCFPPTGNAVIEGACMFLFFFSCCLSPLNSTDYTAVAVCVCVRVCVLCFEAITVAVCEVAVTECVF